MTVGPNPESESNRMAGDRDTALIGGREHRRIEIVDYDPAWVAKFEEHASAIRQALGPIATRIEHIGSTSVPELAAKPIGDILVVVPDPADEASYLPALEAAGYELRVREPDFHEHRMLRTTARDVHVHVYSPDSREVSRVLSFRDRLRSRPEHRRLYERTKRALAVLDWADMDEYAGAKTEVIEEILAAAAGRPSSQSGGS